MVEINRITMGEEGIEDGKRLRTDSTVVETDIHYPTNNSLIWDCMKMSHRLLKKLEEMGKIKKVRNYQIIAPVFQTLWNVTRYYNAYSIILTRDCSERQIEPIFQLQADGIVISGNIDQGAIRDTAIKYNRCFSINISCSALLGTQAGLNDVLRRCLNTEERKGFFLSAEWEVPYDTPVANIHEIMKSIKAGSG